MTVSSAPKVPTGIKYKATTQIGKQDIGHIYIALTLTANASMQTYHSRSTADGPCEVTKAWLYTLPELV